MTLLTYTLLFFSVLFQSYPFSASCLYAQGLDETRKYPLPMAEAEQILSRWLTDSGFKIFRDPVEGDWVRITASRGSESWVVNLKPSSPLASFLSVRYTMEGNPNRTKAETLWTFIEDYLRTPSSERYLLQEVPEPVLSRRESLVCIKARIAGNLIQFSGFLINREGFVLSTAHDLQGVQEIVVYYHQQPFQGRLVKMDIERDLSLIRTPLSPPSPSIPLTKVRELLKDGEKIYTMGCPSNQHQEVNSGMIDGPLRQVNRLPLWQVNMEILPGSSGSPVFDARGDFVGVVKGRYRGSDSIGFLIPARTVLEFLKER
jgi:serine protease Do